MSHDGLGVLHGAQLVGLVGHVLDDDGGHHGGVVVGLVDEGGAATAVAAGQGRVGRRHGGDGLGAVVQLGEGLCEVLGVDELVRGVLEAHLPAVRRAGRGRDEEELAGVGQLEVLGLGVGGGGLAKVDLELLAHDALAVPDLADGDGGVLVEEGDDDAPERLERGKGVDGRRLLDQVADRLQVLGQEDVGVVEVGEEERVGRWRGLHERWQVGQVQTEVGALGDGRGRRGS